MGQQLGARLPERTVRIGAAIIFLIFRIRTIAETSLVEGFANAGAPVDLARLALYQEHKRLANVTRTAISMRPDGDERAARRLAALDDDLMSLEWV